MNKTVKTLWVSSGILVFLWTAYCFIKFSGEPGIVGNVLKLTIGYYLLGLYIIIAIIYWINRALYKRKAKKLRKKLNY
jgi:hypothetical protein